MAEFGKLSDLFERLDAPLAPPPRPPFVPPPHAPDALFLGDRGSNRLDGGAGDDLLFGRGGDDRLDGGEGRDWLIGGPGDDILRGGPDRNVLAGGPGDDLYILRAGDHVPDTIRDHEGRNSIRIEGLPDGARLAGRIEGGDLAVRAETPDGGFEPLFRILDFARAPEAIAGVLAGDEFYRPEDFAI